MRNFGKISCCLALLIFSIQLFPTFCFSSSLSLSPEEQVWLSEHKEIRVSGPQAFPPFQFFNEEDRYVGIAADYLEYIAEQLGITIVYQPKTSWNKVLGLIKAREIDVLSCAAYTEERSKYLLYSSPHITFPLVIVSRKDNPNFRKLSHIDGKRIALIEGISTIASLKERGISYSPHFVTSPKEALKAVSEGQADMAIENLAAASYLIDQNGYTNLKIAFATNFEEYALSIAIRKDWEIFGSIVNKSLSAISDQKHREIRQRWISVRYEYGITLVDVIKWTLLALLAISVVVGGIVLWNRRLIKEIEERKKIELRLRESERKLSTLIANLPGMVYRCRNEKKWPMEFISDGCLAVTGFTPGEISKNSSIKYGDIIHPADQKQIWDRVQESADGDRPFEVEYRIITKSGAHKWVWERGSVVSDLQTDNIYIEGFIADITQQKVLADKLRHAQKMEAIGTLAGGIAHDFNNILSSIIGFTELANDNAKKGSEQEEYLGEVLVAANRAKDLVKQILTYARKTDEDLKPVIIGNLIVDVLRLIRPSTPTSIEIISNLESTSLVMGSESQLHQVVLNLCTNATQSMQQAGGTLQLSLRDIAIENDSRISSILLPPGKYIELVISDNGPGIHPEVIDKIFDPYFTTKGVGEGSGMGLATAKGIVETYGGDIQVSSEEGVETSFIVHLPVTENNSQILEKEPLPLPEGSEHVLIIDDEQPIVTMACRLLESLGYKTTGQTDSSDALELFRGHPQEFDLIITDMTMPAITGDVLALEMRKIAANIPIIVCTGYSNRLSEVEAKRIGINAFVYKPLTKEELARTIRRVLD